MTSLPVNMRCTHAAVEFRAFVVSGFLFALFVLTIAGKKIISLQLTSSSCFIQFISKTKPEVGKGNEEKLTFHKLSFKSC